MKPISEWTQEDFHEFQQDASQDASHPRQPKTRELPHLSAEHRAERYARDMRDGLELMDQPRIAIDLDGTIAQWTPPTELEPFNPLHIGPPRPGAQDLCLALLDIASLWIWTCRLDFTMYNPLTQRDLIDEDQTVSAIHNWLIEHKFPPEIEIYRTRQDRLHRRKPFFCAYIGDDAIPSGQYMACILHQAQKRVSTFLQDALKQPALRDQLVGKPTSVNPTSVNPKPKETTNEVSTMVQPESQPQTSSNLGRANAPDIQCSPQAGEPMHSRGHEHSMDTNQPAPPNANPYPTLQHQLGGLSRLVSNPTASPNNSQPSAPPTESNRPEQAPTSPASPTSPEESPETPTS